MNDKTLDISVVVPVYNEADNIRPFLERTKKALKKIGTFEIIFCLDPCSDNTEEVIKDVIRTDKNVKMIVFSRRFGQPSATMAGILNCCGDSCVVIDVDLQDPPEVIPDMYQKYKEGYDVVLAQRSSREGETLLKRIIANLGYKLINRISDVNIPRNTGDFRIISRRVIEELRLLKESHGFLRGLNSFIGFKQAVITYKRSRRNSGDGKYNRFLGSIRIGFNGIFGFSTIPLSMLLWFGIVILILAILGIIFVFVTKIFLGQNYPMGIPTITILVLFMGGLIITMLGIIGEYIGRIYEEVRSRPLYIIDKPYNISLRDDHGPNSGIISHLNIDEDRKD